jgi:hypothetical protein
MQKSKRKRDLLTALNHIERFHRRRMLLIMHVVVSVGIQFALWANWYASYAVREIGFEGTFFADRIIISVVLGLFMIGHYLAMRLSESKDLLVVKAIEQHHVEDEILEAEFSQEDEYDDQTFIDLEIPRKQSL